MAFLNIFSNKPTPQKQTLEITIDHREKNSLVISELTKLNFNIQFKQLPVADYIIKDVAIERKTISDLKASIINKRIIQQLLELKQYPKHFLILEGEQEDLKDNKLIHQNAARGFLLAVALDFQVPIIYSQNEKDTALYLQILAKKPSKTYEAIRPTKIFKTKKEQLQYILEGFPHIGPTKAQALIKKFKSLKNIINAPTEELTLLLGARTKQFTDLLD
jgi:Fanconi anemia group M protein